MNSMGWSLAGILMATALAAAPAGAESPSSLKAPPNNPFPPRHFCSIPSESRKVACDALKHIMNPDWSAKQDLILLPHRGYWGFGDVAFVPENSLEGLLNVRRHGYAASEVDFMPTEDGLLLSHDYVLTRIAHVSPDDKRLVYDLPEATLVALAPLDRFGNIRYDSRLTDGLAVFRDPALQPPLIFADIKQKEGAGTVYVDNWVATLSRILETMPWTERYRLVVKTPYTPDFIRDHLSEHARLAMDEILWMPQVGSNSHYAQCTYGVDPAVQNSADFVDVWYRTGQVAAFETNWKTGDDSRRAPFTRDGASYANILDYIRAKTGLRGGVFAEEPVGLRGVVNRHARWEVKDASIDHRGDFFFEAVEPKWGAFMVITTDRPDVWDAMRKSVIWPDYASQGAPVAPVEPQGSPSC